MTSSRGIELGGIARTGLRIAAAGAVALALAAGSPAVGQVAVKVAVIDVQRLVTDSVAGKEAIAKLKKLQDDKVALGRSKQDEIEGLRKKLTDGRLSLSEDKIAELEKQLDEKATGFRRFQEDAQKELDKSRDEAFGEIERRVMPVIEQVGKEGGYTLMFNKYQSGLVYADEAIDITDQIVKRFDALNAAPAKGK